MAINTNRHLITFLAACLGCGCGPSVLPIVTSRASVAGCVVDRVETVPRMYLTRANQARIVSHLRSFVMSEEATKSCVARLRLAPADDGKINPPTAAQALRVGRDAAARLLFDDLPLSVQLTGTEDPHFQLLGDGGYNLYALSVEPRIPMVELHFIASHFPVGSEGAQLAKQLAKRLQVAKIGVYVSLSKESIRSPDNNTALGTPGPGDYGCIGDATRLECGVVPPPSGERLAEPRGLYLPSR